MKKVLDFLKKAWEYFEKLITTKIWLLAFPLFVIAISAAVCKSMLLTLMTALWIVTIVYNTDEE